MDIETHSPIPEIVPETQSPPLAQTVPVPLLPPSKPQSDPQPSFKDKLLNEELWDEEDDEENLALRQGKM